MEKIVMELSDEPEAKQNPSSCGAHEIELT
jgi:hypothetical protein